MLTYNGSTWSSRQQIDSLPLMSVSCPSASFCVAVNEMGGALTYDGSSWSSPKSIAPSGWVLESVSCPTTSFCAAVDENGDALTYNGSKWSSPDEIDGASLDVVSCSSASFCVAADDGGVVFTYNGSSWSSPDSIDPPLPGVMGDAWMLNSVSCPTASFCATVNLSGYVLTYNGSTWSSPESIDSGYGWNGNWMYVSCATASFCVAVDSSGNVLTYNGSTWSSPEEIDTSALSSVSCPTASFCVAVDGSDAFTYSAAVSAAVSTTTITSVTSNPVVGESVSIGVEVTGPSTTAGSTTPTGQVTVTDDTRSCKATLSGLNGTATGKCSITEKAPGMYSLTASYPGDANFDSSTTSASTPLMVAKATSKTALKLSNARVIYGDEQVLQLSVTVSPQYSGTTPTGTVTVKESTTTLCVIKLSSGKGSCTLPGEKLNAGTYQLVATYGGSTDFDGSASAKETLTVAKASSKTALKLSNARLTYGDEGAEHLSVTVSPEFTGLTPTGTVTIKESTTTLCTITLSAAKGSCTLSAKKLSVGTYSLVATYGGSTNFKGSTSAKETLTVIK